MDITDAFGELRMLLTVNLYHMKKVYLLLAILCTYVISFAQFNYAASNALNNSGSYTDLGVLGTAITTNFSGGAMAYDDEVSAVQNIGFNFTYNSTTFSQFVLSSNGFIKLGNNAPAADN